jgi:hypothetical protein
MGTTTFSGPLKAGTIKDTTGTTVGTDVANVGLLFCPLQLQMTMVLPRLLLLVQPRMPMPS